ncbi:hypothetical protein Xaut_3166 [Xanthobacter versatilis]|uniref:Uncharacterized protein n=1 Tax=Xanthobacter autotrophicus (strain ATCC BAA-1158 / Py2) TaxID=78245 RepID=A7IK53_XANP2|nr:hypothetical protein Xaut_3166 [Xanthobacter autotrophicus Py2]
MARLHCAVPGSGRFQIERMMRAPIRSSGCFEAPAIGPHPLPAQAGVATLRSGTVALEPGVGEAGRGRRLVTGIESSKSFMR